MTKKFWKDWQKRFGETYLIYMKDPAEHRNKYGYWLFYPKLTRIVHGSFNGDVLTLTLETHTLVLKSGDIQQQVEFETKVINRKDVNTVLFTRSFSSAG